MGRVRHDLIARREWCELTQDDVARALGMDIRSYRRYERGENTPGMSRRRQLAAVLHDWPLDDLAAALDRTANGAAVPSWLGLLASFEEQAAEIQAFEPLVMHGLLQTEAYATAVESVGSYTPEQVDRKVRVRLQRQAVLRRRPVPLRLHVVLDESTLLRVAGDRRVMAGQLDHLLDVAERPNVTIQIMPLSAAVFPAAFGSFSLFTSPGADLPYVACTEDGSGPQYLYKDPDIDSHGDLFDHLATSALSSAETVELIRCTRKEYV